MAHVPSGAVGTGADRAMDLESVDSLLALAHQVDDLEPRAERVVGVLEDRADERGEAVAVDRALLALPLPGAGEAGGVVPSATRARDAVRPAHLNEIGHASVFGGEPVEELREGHHDEDNVVPFGAGVKSGIIP